MEKEWYSICKKHLTCHKHDTKGGSIAKCQKESILMTTREEQQLTYKGKLIRIISDFSSATLEARKLLNSTFQVLKVDNCQVNLSFEIERKIRPFLDKHKLRTFHNQPKASKKVTSC